MLVFYVWILGREGTIDIIDGKIYIFLVLTEVGGGESQSF